MQAGGRRFDPVWLHQTAAAERSSNEEYGFRRYRAAVLFDIVKKGYARDADSRQRSALVLAHRDPRPRRLSSCGAGFVWRDRRLANRKPSVRVYLDATGLSIGGVHRAEKEQEGVRASKARVRPAFSGEHC